MSAESVEKILAQRADRLARPVAEGDPAMLADVVVVVVAVEGSRYALAADSVRQVLPIEALCRLPGEGTLVGLALAAGEAVLVADLASLVGRGSPRRERAFLVVLGSSNPVGVLVDEVLDVVPLTENELRPFSDRSHELSDLATGVMGDVVVLDSDAVLADRRLFVEHPSSAPSGHEQSPSAGAR